MNNDRFQVQTRWTTKEGVTGDGQAMELTGDTGYFWFFSPANVEVVIKVLSACTGSAPRYWVFATGLTDVGVEILVTDTRTNAVQPYVSPPGTPFAPVQHTNAFATCP